MTIEQATTGRSAQSAERGDPRAAIEETYRARTARSAQFHEVARKVIPSGVTRSVAFFGPYPVCIASGKGCRVTDLDGNEYIDMLSNFGSMIQGHAHPAVVRAVHEQFTRGTDFGAPNEPQLALAQAIASRVPSVERLRFTTSGTESNLYAIRAARAFTGRPKILKMEGSYHGGYDTVSVSVDPGADAPPYPQGKIGSRGLAPEVAANTLVGPFNDLARCAEIIRAHRDELAVVIVEAVTVRGMIAADPVFIRGLREVTRECGVLMLLDEVVTFRLAVGGAQQLLGITPDLTSFGKVLGGGLPVGAFGGRADIMDGFEVGQAKPLHHSGTFSGNAAVAAGGLANLAILSDAAITRMNALGDRLRAGLNKAVAAAGMNAQVTGSGSLIGLHFTDSPVTDYRSSLRANRDVLKWWHLSMLNHGVFARSAGAFFLSTPVGEAEVDATTTAFARALEEIRPLLGGTP
jgi:glutamate-1-semialdehyde 2,1-aminomutase